MNLSPNLPTNLSKNPCDDILPTVRSISPYQPGKPITQLSREMGIPVENIVKLASNENPLGMSPKAREAVLRGIASLERYPDDFELKTAIAAHSNLSPKNIVLGNGSNDVIDLVSHIFLWQGKSAVYSQYAFIAYPLAILSAGATPICVKAAPDFGHDLNAMCDAITDNTRIIYIANPNNPTGNFAPYADLKAALKRVKPDVIIVLDEAYNDYIPPEHRENTTAWLQEFPNLIITRTFSKIYGLAGLRVGFALASEEIADFTNRVRQPFNCNNLAICGASAALEDQAFLAESYRLNRAGMAQLEEGFKAHDFSFIPSFGNFISFRAGDSAKTADINQKLLQQGIIVRPLAGYGMSEFLRVTIGTEKDNLRFLEALNKAV